MNLIDVELLLDQFFKEREQGITTLHRLHFINGDQLSLRAFKEDVKEDLRNGIITFINNSRPIEEINDYLFYITNAFCRKISKPVFTYKVEYICPGCVFLGKEYSALQLNTILYCDECKSELKTHESDAKKLRFFSTFFQHNKNGYRCPDCERFIPHPLDNVSVISCPYFDCLFAGSYLSLNKMNHPTSKSNPEKFILDSPVVGISFKDNLVSANMDALLQLELAEDLQIKIDSIKEIIESQSNNAAYSSADFTIKHKQCVYQAFYILLERYPEDMVAYLLNSNDNHAGFQHKIFQEYINLLEKSLPFIVIKNKKQIKIDNLLDENLCLFDGISIFDGIVNDKLSIKNGTKEFYIGGRKATYAKPYYIGKLLNVIHRDTKISLMKCVKEYSFSKIKMIEVKPGTPVVVSHLRVPPHYQMGGMVYVNRIRKKIVDRARSFIQ